jgi:predicted ATPase/DNA-binding winged helix-turn-helix (wHTH) protein
VIEPVHRFGRVELRPSQRQLLVDGAPVALGARAFNVLLALVAHRDRVVPKDELLQLAWPGMVVEENNLQVQVSTLRKLLGPQAISTVAGLGYRFTLTDTPVPAQAGESARPGLPQPRTSLIGRAVELADAEVALSRTRLLSLVALGGTGKTRLAIELARRAGAAFADGVAFVDLAPLQSDAALWPALATSLQWRETPGTPLVEGLLAHLANRAQLLVLDNCETMQTAAAALADRLLSHCPRLVLLATGRQPLGIEGERVLQVPPLALAEGAAAGEVARSDAVRLFVERAAAARPGFVLDERNSAAVTRLCQRLDGLPLALELAAGRSALLEVDQIVERLDRRFELLTGGRDRPARQQRLESVLQWSVEQLTPLDQRRLERLSVFAGGWDLAAAMQVLDEQDEIELLDALSRMHALSLIVADTAATGVPRQHLLETVRAYALQRLNLDPAAAQVQTRHVQACISTADDIAASMTSGVPQAQLRWSVEISNMHAAHAWCDHAPDGAALGLRLANAVAGCCLFGGMPIQGLALATQALARPGADRPTLECAEAWLQVGRLGYFAHRYDLAHAALQRVLQVAEAHDLPVLRARALARLSDLAWPDGDFDVALAQAREAVDLLRRHGGPVDIIWLRAALNALGNTARWTGELALSEQAYEEALAGVVFGPHQVITAVNLVLTRVARGHDTGVATMLGQVAALQAQAASPLLDKNLLRGCTAWAMYRGSLRWALVLMAAEEALAERVGFQLDRGAYVLAQAPAAVAALGPAAAASARAEGQAAEPEVILARARRWVAGAPED